MPVEVRLRLTPGDEKTVHLVDLGEVDRGRGGALFERVEGLARSRLDDVRRAVLDGGHRGRARGRYGPVEIQALLFKKAARHGDNQRGVKSREKGELNMDRAHVGSLAVVNASV